MSDEHTFDHGFADPAEYARMYRSHGFQVVPALSHRESPKSWKRPALAQWLKYQNILTSDDQFKRWYGVGGVHSRRNNIGVITGACSGGIFVIDLDIHTHDGAKGWWQEMLDQQTKAGQLETVEQVTGGGGLQLFFRAPPDWTPPTCKTSIGVDIRGQGGFAMLPPSMHESGKRYWWKVGHEPWEMEIAEAPKWLCDAITELAQKYGGASGVNPSTGQREVTSSPAHTTNAFGMIIDGREDYMTKLIWAAVVDLRRDAPMLPSPSEIQTSMMDAFANYERHVRNRIGTPGVSNADLLEREGRGLSLFTGKWQAAIDQWHDKVAVAAEVDKPDRKSPSSPAPHEEDFGVGSNGDRGAKKPHFEGFPANKATPHLSNLWLTKRVLPKNGLVIVYGAPGSGKSFFVVDIVAHISAPHVHHWRGRKVVTGGVAYCFLEGGFGAQNRIAALAHKLGDLGHFFSYPHSMNLSSVPSTAREIHQRAECDAIWLVASIREQQGEVAVVVVDTLSRAMSGKDENSSTEMTAFIAAMDYIAKELDCLVIVVHHSGKDKSRGARGHSSLLAAIETEIEITRPSNELPGRIAKLTKMKEEGDGDEFAFELQQYPLGQDEDGDPVTTCLVVDTEPDPTKPAAKSVPRGQNEMAVLKAYEIFQCDYPDKYTTTGTGFPEKPIKCVDMQTFAEFAISRMAGNARGNRRKVTDAVASLTAKQILAVNGNVLWRVR